MSKKKVTISGRAGVTAISAVAFLLTAGVLLLTRSANAQGGDDRRPTAFAPVALDPQTFGAGQSDNLLIGLLLPAMPRGGRAYRVEAVTGDGSIVWLSPPPSPTRTTAFFSAFETKTRGANTFTLHLVNKRTGEEATSETTDPSIAVLLLPAVQGGESYAALSSGITVSGFRNVSMADGSVLPIPFQYSEASQAER